MSVYFIVLSDAALSASATAPEGPSLAAVLVSAVIGFLGGLALVGLPALALVALFRIRLRPHRIVSAEEGRALVEEARARRAVRDARTERESR